MLETFSEKDFIQMPWKNGGGFTTEIFRISSNDNDSFIFRLSSAKVSTDGPFSIFPNIDRVLLLLSGKGLTLNATDFTTLFTPIYFQGEEVVECSLISGECVDFNVMTDRRIASSTATVIQLKTNESMNFHATSDFKFIYDVADKVLYKLSKDDKCVLSARNDKTMIIVNVRYL